MPAEGSLDAQSLMGKVTGTIADMAKKYAKPVIAFAGMIKDEEQLKGKGIDEKFQISKPELDPEEAMRPETAKKNLSLAAREVFIGMRQRKTNSDDGENIFGIKNRVERENTGCYNSIKLRQRRGLKC